MNFIFTVIQLAVLITFFGLALLLATGLSFGLFVGVAMLAL